MPARGFPGAQKRLRHQRHRHCRRPGQSNPKSSPYLTQPISTLCFLYSKKIKPLKGMDQGGSEEGRAGPGGRSRALHR